MKLMKVPCRCLLVISMLVSFSGCASFLNPPPTMLESAAGGTLVGAGTGALIAAAIPRGEIANSIGLGAAIGLPAGIIIGNMYRSHVAEKRNKARIMRIRSQDHQIFQNEREIEVMRNMVNQDSHVNLDEFREYDLYTGPTLGNPYR